MSDRTGQYRAQPAKTRDDQESGWQRPAVIDLVRGGQVVQGAVTEVLNSITEADFRGLSLASGRSAATCAMALQAVQTVLQKGHELGIGPGSEQCFDRIEHRHCDRQIRRRVTDRSLLRLIDNEAVGVVEQDGKRTRQTCGTPQGRDFPATGEHRAA
ncbi:MAG: hypothetical protein R3F18_06710 [Lysobacterales bacterium]